MTVPNVISWLVIVISPFFVNLSPAAAQDTQETRPDSSSPGLALSKAEKADVLIAKDVSITTSVALRAKLAPALDKLPSQLEEALHSAQVETAVQGYKPPSEDDLSAASQGDGLGDQVRTGYPTLSKPLVLFAVAERGPYLIASAYVFSPEKSGTLTRISRAVSDHAAASEETVKSWQDCFAVALRKFIENKAAGDQACQMPHPSKNPAPVANSPVSQEPASPALPPNKKSAGTSLLDGLDATPRATVVVPTTPPASTTSVNPQSDPDYHAQLLEQVLTYGFLWYPNLEDKMRSDEMQSALRKIFNREGPLSRCPDLKTLWLDNQTNMGGFLWFQREQNVSFVAQASQFSSIPILPQISGAFGIPVDGIDRYVIQAKPMSCRSDPGRFDMISLDFRYSPVQTNDEENYILEVWAKKEAGWRFPQALEAFAICTAIVYRPPPVRIMVFPAIYDGKVIHFTCKPQPVQVDWEFATSANSQVNSLIAVKTRERT